MAQSLHTRLLRFSKKENETRIVINRCYDDTDELNYPYVERPTQTTSSQINRFSKNTSQLQSQRAFEYDYEAPLTAYSLKPDSKWLIVRRSLHRIRFMSYNSRNGSNKLPDFYLGLQMVRELKRAQEEIQHIDKEKDFHAIKQFVFTIDDKRTKTYNISHIKPNDALIYDRLGEEPMALQNLLYYFSHQNVARGTVFWDFLNEVNHVLNMNRKRTVLVKRLRKIALALASFSYGLIIIMFFLMIISVIATVSKMNDLNVQLVLNDIGEH